MRIIHCVPAKDAKALDSTSDQDRGRAVLQQSRSDRVPNPCLRRSMVPNEMESGMGDLFLRGSGPAAAPTQNTRLPDTKKRHSPRSQKRLGRMVSTQGKPAEEHHLGGASAKIYGCSSSSIFNLRAVSSSPLALVVITSMILQSLAWAVNRLGSPSACIC